MIEVENLTKIYGDKTVVNHTTWTARDGEVTGFIGPNGSGKTTSLKMITGILTPDEGRVLLDGVDIAKEPLKAKKSYGYVSDSPDRFLRLTGLEYLNFMADIYEMPSTGRKEFINQYAERFDIQSALGSTILSYSHGMRQKIQVMGALIHDPAIWLLDEPMTGLDPQSAYELKQMMREHAEKGHSVLFSTHVLEVAEKLCDRVVIIQRGNQKFQGSLEELRGQYPNESTLEDIFMKIVGKRSADDEAAQAS